MDEIICPYCGAEMEREYDTGEYSGYSYATWRCLKCKANAPIIEIGEEMDMCEGINRARDAAAQRYIDPNCAPTPDEIAALRAELDAFKADIEAGRLVRIPTIGSRVYKAQPLLVVNGVVTGVEVLAKDRVLVKLRETGFAPINYAGFWMIDTFPTDEAASAALEGGPQ